MRAEALVDLSADICPRQSAAGAEAAIVAKGAAALGNGPVDVRAGEARVEADFLNPRAKQLAEAIAEAIVSQASVSPGGKIGARRKWFG